MIRELREGDLVKIRKENSLYYGRTGELIGITYNRFNEGCAGFFFTVQFSDTESELFDGYYLEMVENLDQIKS